MTAVMDRAGSAECAGRTYGFRTIGVYTITCMESGKAYIGSSSDIMSRLYGHKSRLRAGNHPNATLQAEFDRHGENKFVFEIVAEYDTVKGAQKEEAVLIRKFQRAGTALNVFVPTEPELSRVPPAFYDLTPTERKAACERLYDFNSEEEFRQLIEQFLVVSGMTMTAFSRDSTGDGSFVRRLLWEGAGCGLRRASQVCRYIQQNLEAA